MSSAKTQKAPSVAAQYGPSMARNALLQPQALHRFKFVSSLSRTSRPALFLKRLSPPLFQRGYAPSRKLFPDFDTFIARRNHFFGRYVLYDFKSLT